MKKYILPTILMILLSGSLVFVVFNKNKLTNKDSNDQKELEVMDNFTLNTSKNNSFSLDDVTEKPIILNFFTTWCPYCKEETKLLHELKKEHDDVEIIMINLSPLEDDLKDVYTFEEKENVTLPILLDENGDFIRMFHIQGTPLNVFLTKDKEIKYIVPGAMDYDTLNLYLEHIR